MLTIAFIAGLSDTKLSQKLAPLQALPSVLRIDLYRRAAFVGDKIRWISVPQWHLMPVVVAEMIRVAKLLMNGWRYDVVIGCHQTYHGVWAWLAGAVWRKPVIQMIIGSVDRAYASRLLRFVVKHASACAVRGPLSVAALRARGYTGPIEILHNVYNADSKNFSSEKFYDFIVVANYAKAKDFPWLIHVLTELKALRRGPMSDVRDPLCLQQLDHSPSPDAPTQGRTDAPFHAALCGRDLEKNLAAAVAAAGLSSCITFLGHCDAVQLERLYASSRIMLLTSRTEGMPMAAIEAMAYGLPVCATHVGELPWLVRDGHDGILFAHGDTKAALHALTKLLKDRQRCDQFGKNARARFVELQSQFAIQSIMQSWERLFRTFIL